MSKKKSNRSSTESLPEKDKNNQKIEPVKPSAAQADKKLLDSAAIQTLKSKKSSKPTQKEKIKNPGTILFQKKEVNLKGLLKEYEKLKQRTPSLNKYQKKAIRRYHREEALKPYQAELIRLQKCLETNSRRMIILFEGRDAAGKGGTIRRVTRYMNEKHYRVVALGKPTEHEKTQWFFQKYVTQFPRGGEVVLFDRSWYNRAIVEPVFGFCTPEEYKNFIRGGIGFEKDRVRQGTTLIKLYCSVTRKKQDKRCERRKTDTRRK
ncbi:MAG: hypothetical protein L3J49_07925, partial [Desulfobulbaceae bacterium]|nr:hypothetical protein [Desulfobulbaceae bacterium]